MVGPSSRVVLIVTKLESPISAVRGTIVAIEIVLETPAAIVSANCSVCIFVPSVS